MNLTQPAELPVKRGQPTSQSLIQRSMAWLASKSYSR
jgi:hypothetical protein